MRIQISTYHVILILLLILLPALLWACDLLGIAGTGGPRSDIYQYIVSVYTTEADREDDNDGWGVLGWDVNGDKLLFRSTYDVFRSYRFRTLPDGPDGGIDRAWPPDIDHDEIPDNPHQMIIHARNASPGTASNIADPHPFEYTFNGRTHGLAHNGSLGDDHYDIMRWLIGNGWWNMSLMDRAWKGDDEDDRRVDSELYAMLLAKNLLLADNYRLGDEWAIRHTLQLLTRRPSKGGLPDFSALNALYTNGDYIYAWCRTYKTTDSDHKLWTTNYPVEPGLALIISHDDPPPASIDLMDWLLMDNTGQLIRVHKDSATSWQDIGYAPENIAIPSQYPVAENIQTNPVLTSLKDGSFLLLWTDQDTLWGKNLDQMGLGEDEPYVISEGIAGVHAVIQKEDADNDTLYIGYTRATSILEQTSLIPEIACLWQNNSSNRWTMEYASCFQESPSLISEQAMAFASNDALLMAWGDSVQLNGDSWQHRCFARYRSPDGSLSDVIRIGSDEESRSFPTIQYLGKTLEFEKFLHLSLTDQQFLEATILAVDSANDLAACSTFTLATSVISQAPVSMDLCTFGGDTLLACAYTVEENAAISIRTLLLDPYSLLGSTPVAFVVDSIDLPVKTEALQSGQPSFTPVLSARPAGGFSLVFNSMVEGENRGVYKIEYDGIRFVSPLQRWNQEGELLANGSYPQVCNVADYTGGEVHRQFTLWRDQDDVLYARFSPSHFENEDPAPVFPSDPDSSDPDDPPTRPDPGKPDTYALRTAYPNPFNSATTLRFDLPNEVRVRITVYDILGREIARIQDNLMEAGTHSVQFTASDLPSGMYFLHLEAGSFTSTQKLVLVK